MNSNSIIEKIKLTEAKSRYLVPFKFLPDTARHSSENSFSELTSNDMSLNVYSGIFETLGKSSDWMPVKTNREMAEPAYSDRNNTAPNTLKSELYSHILKTLSINIKNEAYSRCSDCCIGSTWEYTKLYQENSAPVIRCKIKLHNHNETLQSDNAEYTQKIFEFSIKRVGLFVFRTGIGIFWFELKNSENIKLSPFTKIENFIEFQKCFKQLSAPWQKDMFHVVTGNNGKEELTPFMAGKWINDILNSTFASSVSAPVKIEYYSTEEDCTSTEPLPDKAILFNLALMKPVNEHYFEDVKEELSHIGFMLSNGFNDSYLMPDNIRDLSLKTFDNVLWHASSFGMGQYVAYNKSNAFFFENLLSDRMFSDYFIVYIIILYQQYSVLFYTEQLELTFPSDLNKIGLDTLQKYSERINLFLIKSVYASVSHLEQHNNVYRYISKTMCIKDNINDLTIGLDSLSAIIRNKNNDEEADKDKQISNSLNSLALVVIASALTDTYSFLDNDLPDLINGLLKNNFIPENNQPYCWFIVKTFFILLLFILFINVLWKLLHAGINSPKRGSGTVLRKICKKIFSGK